MVKTPTKFEDVQQNIEFTYADHMNQWWLGQRSHLCLWNIDLYWVENNNTSTELISTIWPSTKPRLPSHSERESKFELHTDKIGSYEWAISLLCLLTFLSIGRWDRGD